MEYLIIISLIMLISIPSFLLYQQQSQQIKSEIELNQIQTALQNIVDSAESIFYLGPPSVETISVYFPEHIKNINLSSYEIQTNISNKIVYVFSKVKINGSIKEHQGIHKIKISAINGNNGYFVQINDEE